MQFYASPEQIMRDRSEYARKGISRGRSAIVLSYADGVLFVAENLTSLRKISEIYDRIGFAAVGRYNEFENLRSGGVRMADLRGYSYDRRDVTARWLANVYAQTLGAIFTEQQKPFEVEICIAQVGASPAEDELYEVTFDGSVSDEPGYVAMGGQNEPITNVLKEGHRDDLGLAEALALAVKALGSVGGEGGAPREIAATQLEVAVLDRRRLGRAFRRVTGAALSALLPGAPPAEAGAEAEPPAGAALTPLATLTTRREPEPDQPAPPPAPPESPAPSTGPADKKPNGRTNGKPNGKTNGKTDGDA
jgi:proteasome alpha subunit